MNCRFETRGRQHLRAAIFAMFLAPLVTLCASTGFAAEPPIALDMRVAGDDSVTRVVIAFDQPVDVAHRLLDNPWRLVLDFGKIGYGFDDGDISKSGLVSNLRHGDMSEDHSRIIFEMKTPFEVNNISKRYDSENDRHNLVIDVVVSDQDAFDRAVDRAITTSAIVNSGQKQDRLGASRNRNKPFTIVLDPGHGGIDDGALGGAGTMEKDVTLAFAKTLRDELETYRGAQVFMTRDSDVFVALNDRAGFARQHDADLFISIHADYLRRGDVRGATVYTISEKASDDVAAAIAADQNLADSVAGVELPETSDGIGDILVDLARRETLGFSVQFARLAVSDMKGFARLIKNPHRFGGFIVLKAPDVPSVLIELGYLSNSGDEKLMNQADWRRGLAQRLALSIEKFAMLSSKDITAAPIGE